MSVKIAQNSATSTTRVAPSTGKGAATPAQPGVAKSDGFDGAPAAVKPSDNGFISPDLSYRLTLKGLSDAQLQQEQFRQEIRMLVSQFLGDYGGAADARKKLGFIQEERDRRVTGGGDDHQIELARYRSQLRGMNDWQLASEERKQQGSYWYAMLTGNPPAARLAQEKLEAVHAEQDRRWTYWPVDPLPIPLPPVYRDPKGGPINY